MGASGYSDGAAVDRGSGVGCEDCSASDSRKINKYDEKAVGIFNSLFVLVY